MEVKFHAFLTMPQVQPSAFLPCYQWYRKVGSPCAGCEAKNACEPTLFTNYTPQLCYSLTDYNVIPCTCYLGHMGDSFQLENNAFQYYYIKNQQDATLAVLFINHCKITLHVSDAFSRPSSGALKTVVAATGACHGLG